MFQKEELARLQEQKTRLLVQSEVNRRKLTEDWHRLSSVDFWVDEAHGMVRRHPAMTAGLAAAGGLLAARLLRKPSGITGAFGSLTKLASIAHSVWQMFRKQKEQ